MVGSNRIYRSRNNKMISGVAGGIAEYLGIDVTLIRLLWILIGFTAGIGFVAYLVAAIVIPEEPAGYSSVSEPQAEGEEGRWHRNRWHRSEESRKFFGLVLVGIGGILLVQNVFHWLDLGRYMGPLLLILIGVAVFTRGLGGGK